MSRPLPRRTLSIKNIRAIQADVQARINAKTELIDRPAAPATTVDLADVSINQMLCAVGHSLLWHLRQQRKR